MKFRDHKYEFTIPYGEAHYHIWSLRGPEGGVHFRATRFRQEQFGTGIEFHHIYPGEYFKGEAAHNTKCWLCGCPCWHHGSSLSASETLWPKISPLLETGDHEAVFRLLEIEYDKNFEAKP